MELLRHRSFAVLLLGRMISVLGDALGSLAIAYLVYEVTGSKLAMGGVMVAVGVPMAVTRLLGGPLVDRVDRRQLMVITYILRGAIWLLIPLLHLTGIMQIWMIYPIAVAEGIVSALFDPALMSTVPNLVPRKELDRANGFLESGVQLAFLFGPALGGTLVSFIGIDYTLVITGALFLVSAVVMGRLPAQRVEKKSQGRGAADWLQESKEGFAFFRQVPVLLWLLLLVSLINLASTARAVLMVPWSEEVLRIEAWQYGLLQSLFSGGFAVGALLAPEITRRTGRRVAMLVGLAGNGLFSALCGLTTSYWLVITLFVISGALVPLWNVSSNAIYQERVPDELRGRVYSLRMLMAQGTQPLGMLLGGAMGEGLGIPFVFVTTGLAEVAVMGAGFFVKAIKEIDRPLAELEA